MNLLFMGTPEFATPALKALIASEHRVLAVYTQPPRPAGRGQKERKSPVHLLAESHGIPVHTPATLKDRETQSEFRSYRADIAVVAAYGLLLPAPVLEGAKHGCVNIHPSLLPRWRGAAPLQRAIMAGDTETGVCIMRMEQGLDTGPVYAMEKTPLPDDMTAGELHDLLAEEGARLLLRVLKNMEEGKARAVPQSEEGVTYAHKIDKAEARIDWTRPASGVLRHIHGLSPSPGAYFEHNGEKYRILKACLGSLSLRERARVRAQASGVRTPSPHPSPGGRGSDALPGTVLNPQLHIACMDGVIQPTLIQRQGKNVMPIEVFLQGNVIPLGTLLR